MNQKSINYLMRFALHGGHYSTNDCREIEHLAQLYGTDPMHITRLLQIFMQRMVRHTRCTKHQRYGEASLPRIFFIVVTSN